MMREYTLTEDASSNPELLQHLHWRSNFPARMHPQHLRIPFQAVKTIQDRTVAMKILQ
jgi:hypothetical protein